jgi:hypothetical protein
MVIGSVRSCCKGCSCCLRRARGSLDPSDPQSPLATLDVPSGLGGKANGGRVLQTERCFAPVTLTTPVIAYAPGTAFGTSRNQFLPQPACAGKAQAVLF